MRRRYRDWEVACAARVKAGAALLVARSDLMTEPEALQLEATLIKRWKPRGNRPNNYSGPRSRTPQLRKFYVYCYFIGDELWIVGKGHGSEWLKFARREPLRSSVQNFPKKVLA